MKTFLIIVSISINLVILISCGNKDKKDAAKTGEAQKEEEHEKPGEATLTTGQMKTIGVELGSIRIRHRQINEAIISVAAC